MDDRVALLDRQLSRLHRMFARSMDRFEANPSDAELEHMQLLQQEIIAVSGDMEQAIKESWRGPCR